MVMTNCTGANAQYLAMANCMNACTTFGWAVGTTSDSSGNTLGCRVTHAQLAASVPMQHCPHAGPLGGTVCGASDCGDFCAADVAVCGTIAYPSLAACMTSCTAFTDMSAPDLAGGTGQLGCRTYHLTNAAAAGAAGGHCPHTSMSGGGVCP
jgi:hypothetical protein